MLLLLRRLEPDFFFFFFFLLSALPDLDFLRPRLPFRLSLELEMPFFCTIFESRSDAWKAKSCEASSLSLDPPNPLRPRPASGPATFGTGTSCRGRGGDAPGAPPAGGTTSGGTPAPGTGKPAPAAGASGRLDAWLTPPAGSLQP